MFEGERTILDTLAWELVGGVLVLCTGQMDASDDDLERWLSRLGRFDYAQLLISATGGGGLKSIQRAKIADFWKAAPVAVPPTALMTDSAAARFAMTAIHWLLGGESYAFGAQAWEQALTHLGTDVNPTLLQHAVKQLQHGLRERLPASA